MADSHYRRSLLTFERARVTSVLNRPGPVAPPKRWRTEPECHGTQSFMSGFDDTLTNLARPKISCIITVRVIKSFEFRTERSLVLRDINLETTTVGDFKEIVRNGQPLVRFTELPVCAQTIGFNSDSDPTRMETVSLCALWFAKSPSATVLRLWIGTLTLFLALFLFLLRLSFIDTLKLYTHAHGAKVWPW